MRFQLSSWKLPLLDFTNLQISAIFSTNAPESLHFSMLVTPNGPAPALRTAKAGPTSAETRVRTNLAPAPRLPFPHHIKTPRP